MKTTTVITTLALAAIIAGVAPASFAQEETKLSQINREELRELRESGDREAFKERIKELVIKRIRPELSDEQKEAIKDLQELGDKEAIKDQLNEWGIEKSQKKKGLQVMQKLTQEQQQEIKELRESGADKEEVRQQLESFGVELPERVQITDEQKGTIKELRESGDRELLKEYYIEIGLTKKVEKMEKRKSFVSSLTDDEKEVLEEAREIAKAGDKETAREMIQEVFEVNDELEKASRGIRGFFKRIFK